MGCNVLECTRMYYKDRKPFNVTGLQINTAYLGNVVRYNFPLNLGKSRYPSHVNLPRCILSFLCLVH